MARDDFFLSFGTDADVFANKIGASAEKSENAILDLAQALQTYDKTLEKVRGGGPLGNLFSALDDAASRFGSLTSQLVTGFDKALAGVGELTGELAGLVDAVNKINELKPAAHRKIAQGVNDVGNEDIAAVDNTRRNGKAVGEIIELNATQARNALKRVADINATVGRNSNSAADGLKVLAQQIRELNGAAKEAKGRGTFAGGGGGGNVIIVNGGTVTGGAGAPSNLSELIADALSVAASSTTKTASEPAPSDLAQDRLIAKGKVKPLSDFSAAAAPGKYLFQGSPKGGRLVGSDVRENETFEQYFARNDATRARIEESRAALPKPERADLVDFNQFKLSGGRAKDYASGLESTFRRTLAQDKNASSITAESIKASLTDLGLEKQYPKLPGIIERIFKVRAEQRAAAEKTIKGLIQEDPGVTFGGGALGITNSDFEVGNTFGSALHSVDEELLNTHEGDPKAVALAQARRDAQEKRKLFRQSPRSFDHAVDPATLRGVQGTEDQEGLSAAAIKKDNLARRRAGLAASKAAVAALSPIDQELVSARREGNVELQNINASLGKRSLSTAEIADALGLKRETTRQPANNVEAFQRHAEIREVNLARLTALDSDPEGYTARERERAAAQVREYRESGGTGLEKTIARAESRSKTLTPAVLRSQLNENIADATEKLRDLTSHTEVLGLTDQSHAQAREALENRRAAILAETIKTQGPEANDAGSGPVAKATRQPRNKGALVKAREVVEELKTQVVGSAADDDALLGTLAAAEAEVARLAAARVPKAAATGGSGGAKPPKPPRNASAAGEPQPDDGPEPGAASRGVFDQPLSKKSNRSTSAQFQTNYSAQIALLQEDTKALLANAAARLQDTRLIGDQTERIRQQNQILVEAGAAFKNDSFFKLKPNLTTARGTFAQAVGLPSSKDNYNRLQSLFTQGGGIDASGLVNKAKKVAEAPLTGAGGGSAGPGGTLGRALFGNAGFLNSQLRHVGQAIENFAGFQLVFSGFEKLKELVDTGIQADAVFVRLQSAIGAAGRTVGNLRVQLQSVSSGTATGLKDTIEAASELSGVFKNNNDLVAGTRVATELANISEGALTAKESAVGLRDVIDAYGLTGTDSVRKVGDQIARLSQVTGVSVKDVLEGTTKLAQVGRQYGLTQPQAATYAAFVTRNTGETGEAAAEQVDRIFSTLDGGAVQKALVNARTKAGVPIATPADFTQGKQGKILDSLLTNFENLDPSNKAEIRGLVSRGRQAPAFAGFIRDGKLIGEQAEAVASGSEGALKRQNDAYLDTLAGQLKVLGVDFKNLGASLQQSGFFDLIGLMAKGLDVVFKTASGILNVFNELANSNPFTKAIKEIAVVVGEVALLIKLFGGGAGQLLGLVNPKRRTVDKLDRAGSVIRNAEGIAEQEFAPVTGRGVLRGIRNSPLSVLRGIRNSPLSVFESSRSRLSGFSAGGFFAGPNVSGQPGTSTSVGPQEHYGLTGSQRFAAARSARAEQVLNGNGGLLTRTLANSGAVGLAGVTNGIATATRGIAGHMTNLTRGLVGLARGFLGPLAAMLLFGYAIDKIVGVFQRSSQIGAAADALADDIRGKNDAKNKNDDAGKNADGSDKTAASGVLAKNKEAQDKANNPGILDGTINGILGKNIDANKSGNFIGTFSDDNGFDRNEAATVNLLNKRLRNALKIKDPKKQAEALQKAATAGEKDIKEEQGFIDTLGLNSEQKANAEAELGNIRAAFQKSYAKLLANAEGLNEQDTLNVVQSQKLIASLNTAGSLKSETLRGAEGKETKEAILSDSTAPTGSKAYKALSDALSGDSTRARLQAQLTGDEEARRNALHLLKSGAQSGPEREANRKVLDDANQKLQADQAAIRSLDQNNPLTLSQIAVGRGDTKDAVANQKKAIAALENANKAIGNKDDPEYIANLKKIQEEKKTLADLTYEGAILAAAAAAAASNDPLVKARKEYEKAIEEQKSVLSRPHSNTEAQQAQAAVDQANISKAQQGEDLKVAQFQASIAGRVDNSDLIAAQINENLRQQKKYADGTLASQIKLTQLKGEEATLREKLVISAFDIRNAAIETRIAELTARGKAGDLEAAANLQVGELQGKLAQYLQRPGAKKTDPAYQALVGQLATAQRNAFDVALQAQLDTLDFQKETYKITGSQEVQALQEILKNKQLTLKEQRDITLKIKNLQESIRQQLTGGGFNIPSDIKLPTAYQVRRSLGGGFGNGQTTVTNNSTSVQQTNTYNVPTAQVAQQIAAAVIAQINASTGQSTRANTSTPRLVGT